MVRVRGRLLIEDLADGMNLSESEILEELRKILKASSTTFGLRPFRIEFDGLRGWSILPSSCVGVLSGDILIVAIDSRLSNLSTEKLISLAQIVGPDVYRISSDAVRATISNSSEFGARDLLAMSLVDICGEIRRSGRDFKYVPASSKSFNIRGAIDFAESLQTGSVRPPVSTFDTVTFSTDANLYILSALKLIRDKTRLDTVLQAVSNELNHWSQEMHIENDYVELPEISDFSISYPRSDYSKALSLSTAILLDLAIEIEGSNTSIPQVLADVDLLFEQYCTNQLRQLLPSSTYDVRAQNEFPHPSQPKLSGHIKPDLVVTNRDSGKSIVIDLKNKYSQVQPNEEPSLGNPDIFQISYYALALNVSHAMLVYPTTENAEGFPIKKSESVAKYASRIERFRLLRLNSEPVLNLGLNKITLVPYQVDLSGSMSNTAESLASLAMYIDYLLSEDLS